MQSHDGHDAHLNMQSPLEWLRHRFSQMGLVLSVKNGPSTGLDRAERSASMKGLLG